MVLTGTMRWRKRGVALALLAPATLIIAAIFVYPIVVAVRMSLFDVPTYNPVMSGPASLRNYHELATSGAFWRALATTITYTVVVTASASVVGLATAVLLRAVVRGRRLFRTALALPWVIPPAIVALIWKWMFEPQSGVVNHLLHLVGATPVRWFHNPSAALVALIVTGIWHEYPFFLITVSAGLEMIPKELYEAAELDQANGWQKFWYVTLPALRPLVGVSVVLSALMSFRQYDLVAVLTGGGPAGATETLALAIYKNAFQYFRMGYASALGTVSLIISVLLVVTLLSRLAKEFY
ncbi:carbohydrate ABC transporter permease [Geochorda subterranea]|uniref:Sugar ABC transporter permease n=1 Tax=Geochorda subterranea TaxID=3109564 RepID=A0ABZ1BM60_9FIRM|nr:sugar ABC transporter permease [Limnochorda sp. LNt]WRP13769.1 sugar ABC transporter permease [Limnochorda sp. LNt]